MERRPDPALGGLLLAIVIGFMLVMIIPSVFTKGLIGTLAFFGALVAFAVLTAVIASATVWLTRRLNRLLAVLTWTGACLGCMYWAGLYGAGVLEKSWWSHPLVIAVLVGCTAAWFEAVLGPGTMGHWGKKTK